MMLFTILANPPAIRCGLCRKTSYNLGDVEHHYCGACHLFLDVVAEARVSHAEGATHDCGEWPTALGLCAICGRYVDPQK